MRKKTKREADLLENSIERVINTTLRALELRPGDCIADEQDHYTARDDWKNLKRTACEVWNEARDAAFVQRLSESDDPADRRRAREHYQQVLEDARSRVDALDKRGYEGG